MESNNTSNKNTGAPDSSFSVQNEGGNKLWQLLKGFDTFLDQGEKDLAKVIPSVDDAKESFDYLLTKERDVWIELVDLAVVMFASKLAMDSNSNRPVIIQLRRNLRDCNLRKPDKIVPHLKELKELYSEYADFVQNVDDLLAMKEIRDRMILRLTPKKSGSREDLMNEKMYVPNPLSFRPKHNK